MRINKKNLEKDKSLSFFLYFGTKKICFFCLYYETEGVLHKIHLKQQELIIPKKKQHNRRLYLNSNNKENENL